MYGVCDQRCHNLKGTFTCSCDEGYSLHDDRKTCHANGEILQGKITGILL